PPGLGLAVERGGGLLPAQGPALPELDGGDLDAGQLLLARRQPRGGLEPEPARVGRRARQGLAARLGLGQALLDRARLAARCARLAAGREQRLLERGELLGHRRLVLRQRGRLGLPRLLLGLGLCALALEALEPRAGALGA